MRLFFLTKVLTIEGWHLILTAIGVVIPIILMLMGIEKSRSKKLDERLEKKASKEMVRAEFQRQNLKIEHVESMSMAQDKYISDSLAEQYAILETVQKDIKRILTKI